MMQMLDDMENALRILKVNIFSLQKENKELKKQIKKLRTDIDQIINSTK
jgi:prefoldin subunit 5